MRRVMVTGGTGAWGREAVRQLLRDPGIEAVVVYSRDEHKHQRMEETLEDPGGRVRYMLGDVRDRDRLALAMRGCDTVLHAAALKVVPLLEYSPAEAVRTNVDGALNVIEAALRTPDVRRVIAISTDKAVAPVNLYGATKAVAERLFLAANDYGGRSVRFDVARYGNVTGSTGSVTELWQRQMAAGEPLTVTDPDMTRFWITLPRAVCLVLAMACEEGPVHGRPPGVWVPVMPAYRVGDLLSVVGGPDVVARIIGRRPGERRHETVVAAEEWRERLVVDDVLDGLPPGNLVRNSWRWIAGEAWYLPALGHATDRHKAGDAVVSSDYVVPLDTLASMWSDANSSPPGSEEAE